MKSRACSRPALMLLLSAYLFASAPPARGGEPTEFRKAETRTQAVAERVVAATVGLGRGSGVIVSEDGMIMTAAHVLAAAEPGEELTVVLSDGRRTRARALGCDHTSDAGLAQIIDRGKWPFAERGSSAGVKPGDWCLALGHPGGVDPDRKPPVRIGRVLTAGPGDRMINGLSTDATVAPGDSGGPLFDLDGKVIGIHSNIGFGPLENRHVPADRFQDRWDAFVRGQEFGLPVAGELGRLQKAGARTLLVGDAAPALAADRWVRGGELKTFEKGKVYVIAFWATKSEPCVAGMKHLTDLQQTYKEKGVTVVGVTDRAGGDTPEDVENVLKAKGDAVGYAIAVDTSGRAQAAYTTAAGCQSLPVVFVVDGAGRLAHVGRPDALDAVLNDVCADTWDLAKAAAADKKREDATRANVAALTKEFTRRLREQAKAGDPEAQAIAKGDRPAPTVEKMTELVFKWGIKDELAAGGAGANAAVALNGTSMSKELEQFIQKYSQPGPNKSTSILEVPADKMDEFQALIKRQGATNESLKFGKSGPGVMPRLSDVAARSGKGVVAVQCGGKTVALGAVVRKDGYVVTKASELSGPVACEIGGREYRVAVVGTDPAHDLALLRVKADDLTPVEWVEDKEPPLGSWLVTPGAGGKVLAFGVLGQPGRKIGAAKVEGVRRSVLGVSLDPAAEVATVQQVSPDGPARRAGFRPGDVITAVGDRVTKDGEAVHKALDVYTVGDKVTFTVRRGAEEVTLAATLAAPESLAEIRGPAKADAIASASGRMSNRADGFPCAFGHDGILQAQECGGPVVGLDGRAVGLNIARADRTTTFVIPARVVKSVVAALIAAAR